MAVTKLRADAPPFLSRCHIQSPLLPPLHHQMAVCAYHPAAACSPGFTVVPSYPAAPFLVPAPAPGSIYGFHPPLHPAAVPVRPFLPALPRPPQRKAKAGLFRRKVFALLSPQKPAVKGPFHRKAGPSPPPVTPPAPLSSRDVPSPPPPTKPAPLSREALPHGIPPHKLMLIYGGRVVSQKRQARAAATARAAEPVATGQEPAPAAGPRHGKRMSPPRLLRGQQQQAAGRGRSGKDLGCRQAKALVERARKQAARSPSPVFTTRPPSTVPAPEWRKQRVTTVMIRNIPNKLKPCEMVQLLDEHCARANSKKKKKPVLAAYDFLYLPMDFSKRSSNMGYAFVNLTTPEAARGLHYALHGARWKVHGTKKVIDICAARIQGKEALVSHFSGSTFPCHTDEYLPAAFSPPRDGAAGPSAVVKHVGNRVHTPPPPPQPAPLPLPVAPAPVQQEWRLKQSPSS